MKVLMLKAYYEPEIAAGIYLASELVEDMSKEGIRVDVYTPMPTRGIDENVRRKYNKEKKKEVLHKGQAVIHRFGLWREGTHNIGRAFRYVVQNIIEIWIGITKKYDILLLGSTPPTNGVMGAIIKKIRRKRFIYVIDDMFPDSLVAAKITKEGSILYRIGRWMEKVTYRNADDIIVISDNMKQRVSEKGVSAEKVYVVYNWIDENVIKPIERQNNTLFTELELDEKLFYVTYAGNLGHSQNIEVILRAAERLKNTTIEFLIFGEGSQKEQLKKMLAERQLTNIRLLPLQPYERVSEVYSLGDVSIVTCYPGTGKTALPSKTWSIMAAGRPVIASFDKASDMERIIVESKAGLFADADDDKRLSECIMELYQNPERCRKMGQSAQKFVQENIARSVSTKRYCDIIKKN